MEHHFDVDIAKEVGIEGAVVLNNLYFWIKKNEANNQNFFDGCYWTYNSADAFSKLFPYFTARKITRILNKLKDDGWVLVGNYNKLAFDRTNWYTLTNKALSILDNSPFDKNGKSNNQECPIEKPIVSDGLSNSVQPIPYNKPDKKPNKNTDVSENEVLPFDLLPDGALKEALLEFRKYRSDVKNMTMSSMAEKKLITSLTNVYGDDTEAKVEAIDRAIVNNYQGAVFPGDKEKYLRSKQANKPRYNPMNPSGSRYTEQELDDLNLPF